MVRKTYRTMMEAGTLLLRGRGTHLFWQRKKICMKDTQALTNMSNVSNILVQWELLNSEKNSVFSFWLIKEYTGLTIIATHQITIPLGVMAVPFFISISQSFYHG